MVDYFRTDPTLAAEYDQVLQWGQWPHRDNSHDVGIDLVARQRLTGEWTAVQCKFYDPRHTLQKADIDSFFTASGKVWDGIVFTNRVIISTTDRWGSNAEAAITGQTIPVQRIGMAEIAASPIDWMLTDTGRLEFEPKRATRYSLREHQKVAVSKILDGFQTHDRGQWISACGTGKTFTSLRLAEQMCATNDGHLRVLFLAPSISLVSQTLREWMAQTQTDIFPFVVCSDTKAGRSAEDITTRDIPLPTTDPAQLAAQLAAAGKRGRYMTVVFSTYQSIDSVAQATHGGPPFDLVLCDEAHRTTGVTLTGDTAESAFVKVHDNTYLPATKRLYMTATPRIYGDAAKQKATDAAAVLTSMDNEDDYGPVFHRLGFGEAVEQDLLSDYKVMILAVENDAIAENLQGVIAGADHEISLDDAAKIVGCWNGLAKRTTDLDFGANPTPMQRAVAFCDDIKTSKKFADAFPLVTSELTDDGSTPICSNHHVDGTMNALQRAALLDWLKAPIPTEECRILSNARCLSEGVDVPALDAVLFLHPRNSLVDVVQSVGRVMRKAPGKKYGYVILPVAIPAGIAPEKALNDNKRFKVVWDVLNALRSHDDRFNSMINSIDLDKDTSGKLSVDIIGIGNQPGDDLEVTPGSETGLTEQLQDALFSASQWKDSILARIVKKVGDRQYWENWASDVAAIDANQVARITAIVNQADPQLRGRFDAFVAGLRGNLNDSITDAAAISMLSQHLITRPVFDALFDRDSFAAHNPVSIAMQTMVEALAGHGLDAETGQLAGFYESVQRRAAQIHTAAGRQTVISELYGSFFKTAFPKLSESLGVVYTPVEIVEFIIRAADDACKELFGYGLTDQGVHILDPFTGTGTFIVRLLESGIIQPGDLARKYSQELWANELMLLAYYIACVNIETTYQALATANNPDPDTQVPYAPFPGGTLVDTFQSTESGDKADTSLIPVNNDRIEAQLNADIRVIIGNPPYSAGQNSANDNNANLTYPTLDRRIANTYAKHSTATNKNSLYDSYIRAFRWASDRLGDQGLVAFVSNNGWIDGNTADGLRKTFTTEYSHIWIYNLRGNQRTTGELSRQEGGKVFGSGSRTGVSILIAAKQPGVTTCTLRYYGVDNYQTAEQKLDTLTTASLDTTPWQQLAPNDAGDWLNQRDDTFQTHTAIGGDKSESNKIFTLHSSGLKTNRDAWCYNFSRTAVQTNMTAMIATYTQEAQRNLTDVSQLTNDPTRISWTDSLKRDAVRGTAHQVSPDAIWEATYRPFTNQTVYFDRTFNERVYRMPTVFPTPHHLNTGLYVVGPGSNKPFSSLMTQHLPDLALWGSSSGQYFPRWTYIAVDANDQGELVSDADEWGYRRIDNITDTALTHYRAAFGDQVSKDDIFYYTYAVLHSPQYRERYAADLKRMLPRIPLAAGREDFEAFTVAGRALSDLHTGYEAVVPYPLTEQAPATPIDDWALYRVEKMRWVDKTTKRAIRFNDHIILGEIPDTAARYQLGSRSALEWLIDRYQVKTDKASQLVNDPNDWAREHNDPRYIIDLVKRVTRVSVETMTIVDGLPTLPLA